VLPTFVATSSLEMGPTGTSHRSAWWRLGSEPLFFSATTSKRFLEHFGSHLLFSWPHGVSEPRGRRVPETHDRRRTAARGAVPAGYPPTGRRYPHLATRTVRAVRDGESGRCGAGGPVLSEWDWRRAYLTHATFQSDPADSRSRIILLPAGYVLRLLPETPSASFSAGETSVRVRF